MQKSLTHKEVLAARRKNSMILAVLFSFIAIVLGFAFGQALWYVLAVFGFPVVLISIWEEVNSQYISRNPEKAANNS